MLKIKLPNGLQVEGDTPQEVAEMLKMLGVPVREPDRTPPAPFASDEGGGAHSMTTADMTPGQRARLLIERRPRPGHWSPSAAAQFLVSLPQGAQGLLHALLEPGAPELVPTGAVAHRLQLSDPKPIGSMLASIRRRAEQMGLPNPVVSQPGGDDDAARVIRLELDFRQAVKRLNGGEG